MWIQQRYGILRPALAAMTMSAVAACATSPLGRTQLQLFDSDTMATMGVAAFDEIKSQEKVLKEPGRVEFVNCVAGEILDVIDPATADTWEIRVFENEMRNAFALPGRKIGIYTGMLDIADEQSQLAAVVAHEIAHVIAGHGNERMSTAFAASTGTQIAAALITDASNAERNEAMALLGLGVQVGVLLPFSRTQEREADLLGLHFLAKAGFDPDGSISLWQEMAKAGNGSPPEFLSTHPHPKSRIRELSQAMTEVGPIFLAARSSGRRPNCGRL